MNKQQENVFDELLDDLHLHRLDSDTPRRFFEAGLNYKSPTKKGEYSEDFLTAWDLYPKREGNNNKKTAYKAWKVRLKTHTPEDLLNGTKRYHAYCKAEGSIGGRFVMMAATFYGADEHYAQDWKITATTKESGTPEPKSEQAWLQYGEKINIPAGMGELMPQYVNRLRNEFTMRER